MYLSEGVVSVHLTCFTSHDIMQLPGVLNFARECDVRVLVIVCVCVRACVRACVRGACMHACVCVCVCVCVSL